MIKQVHFYANKSCYYICKPLILSAFSYAYFPLFHRLCTGSGYQELQIERFVALFSLDQTLTQENLISDSEFTIYKKGVVTHSFLFLSVFKFKISFSPQSCCRQSSYFMIMLFHNHFDSIYNVDA